MQMVNELGNDLAFAVLKDRKHGNRIDSKDVIPLINRIREVLEPISEKDHSYSGESDNAAHAVAED